MSALLDLPPFGTVSIDAGAATMTVVCPSWNVYGRTYDLVLRLFLTEDGDWGRREYDDLSMVKVGSKDKYPVARPVAREKTIEILSPAVNDWATANL